LIWSLTAWHAEGLKFDSSEMHVKELKKLQKIKSKKNMKVQQ
jgi:hypothetical protein